MVKIHKDKVAFSKDAVICHFMHALYRIRKPPEVVALVRKPRFCMAGAGSERQQET